MRRRPDVDDQYDDREDPRARDIDALLRSSARPLVAPAGTWDSVRRRARRRRWIRATAVVGTAGVVIAGGVPLALHLRHTPGGQQQVQVANQPTTAIPRPPHRHSAAVSTPSPVPAQTVTPATLTGFRPTSVSFVTQDEGFLLGPAHGTAGALARTTDGGRTWTRLPAPEVNARDDSSAPATVRFATPDIGFVFGQHLDITTDGGQSWQRLPAPGFIDDLATMDGRVWALVAHGTTVRLYGATLDDPTLQRVAAVPALHGGYATPAIQGSAGLAVYGSAVDVITAREFYYSPNGQRWKAGTNPCPAQVHGTYVQSTSVAAWNASSMVAVCGEGLESGTQTKQAYVSVDGGHGWTTVHKPTANGYLRTLGAGSAHDVIVGQTRYGAQLSHNGGHRWNTPEPQGLALSFVGFIDPEHVVALADGESREFLASYNAGRTWTVTTFPS